MRTAPCSLRASAPRAPASALRRSAGQYVSGQQTNPRCQLVLCSLFLSFVGVLSSSSLAEIGIHSVLAAPYLATPSRTTAMPLLPVCAAMQQCNNPFAVGLPRHRVRARVPACCTVAYQQPLICPLPRWRPPLPALRADSRALEVVVHVLERGVPFLADEVGLCKWRLQDGLLPQYIGDAN
jgi:hypothetical protein